MCTKKLLVWLCSAGTLFVSGCASNTIIMTPPVKAAVVPASNSSLYKVNKVAVPMAPYSLRAGLNSKAFTDRFAGLTEARYPDLFKNTPEAVPVNVQIEIIEEVHDGLALVTFMGTLGILGGLLPSVPWTTEWQIKVGIEDFRGTGRSSEVRAVHRGWWSLFSPCGLIAISGESDVSPVSTVMTGGPGSIPPELRDYITRCMVDLLAKELLNGKSPTSPAQPFLLAPEQTPSLLQLPIETVAPF